MIELVSTAYVSTPNGVSALSGKMARHTVLKLLIITSTYIEFKYVSKGTDIHQNIKQQSEELKKIVSTFFPSPAVVNFDFIGAQELYELSETHTNNNFTLDLESTPINLVGENHICIIKLSNYYRFITNNDGDIIKYIFESNVRDYQGNVSVNKEIQTTLAKESDEDFWWLNNGVTILASSATYTQKN